MQQIINLKNSKYRKQAGLTLLELSIGLGIVLAIAALAIGIGTVVQTTQRSSDAQTQLLQIAAAARQAAVGGAYDGITSGILARQGRVPAAWIGSTGTTISNPFGGEYVLAPANLAANGTVALTCNSTTGTTPCNAIAITVNQLQPSACTSLINNSSGNFAVIVNGAPDDTALKNDRASPVLRLNPEAVTTACEAGNATISFVTAG